MSTSAMPLVSAGCLGLGWSHKLYIKDGYSHSDVTHLLVKPCFGFKLSVLRLDVINKRFIFLGS